MFTDVGNRLPTTHCVRCRLPISKDDALVQVLTAVGIAPGFGLARTVYINELTEVAHLRCAEPAVKLLRSKMIQRSHLKIGDPMHVDKMSPDFQCLCCGKVYARGDRFLQVFRAEGVALDSNKIPGMRCSDGYETAHLNCQDPQVVMGTGGGVILTGGGDG